MKIRQFIRRYLCLALAGAAVLLAASSALYRSTGPDIDSVASHVSRCAQRRMQVLENYALKVLDSPQQWPQIGTLPQDMVIYKYCSDTLAAWYNHFNVDNDDISRRYVVQRLCSSRSLFSSPLSDAVTDAVSYVNMGPEWYLVKAYQKGDVRLIAGLEVRNTLSEDLSRSRSGVNPNLHVHGRFSVIPLCEGEGAAVVLDGSPVFKVTDNESLGGASSMLPAFIMLWAAMLLLSLSVMLYLVRNRTVDRCIGVILLFALLAFAARFVGGRMGESFQIFSPTLFAHDALLNSFGTLCVFSIYIFLGVLALYICRRRFSIRAAALKGAFAAYVACLCVAIVSLLFYVAYTLGSLILNSSITLDLYGINQISVYTAVVYLIYSLLCTGILMLLECLLDAVCRRTGRKVSVMTRRGTLIFAIASTLALGVESSSLGFRKEVNRVSVWSNRLAVDRDLSLEIDLRRAELSIAADPMIGTLCKVQGSEALIEKRLEEVHLLGAAKNYDISVMRLDGEDLHAREALEKAASTGVPIVPESRFLYCYDSSAGGSYAAVFTYYEEGKGTGSILLNLHRVISKRGSGYADLMGRTDPHVVNIPSNYSWAKYSDGRLTSFNGNFAYPTVLHGLVNSSREGRSTFSLQGWRHFVTAIGDSETIVMTRRERRAVTFLVAYSYLVLLLFALSSLFRARSLRRTYSEGRFAGKMRKLIVSSLSITLVVMASVSVVFVYQHNERNMLNMMSAKISGLQLQLDAACRQMTSASDMRNPQFASLLQETASNAQCDINIYTPGGRMFLSSSPETPAREIYGSRIDPDAFRAITYGHERFYIARDSFAHRRFHTLYAPVFNAGGQILAIIGTPYLQTDYDFMRDAVFHAATIVTLFLIMLIVTILLASSIIRSIFHPLTQMGDKMALASVNSLEPIRYAGNDEISVLVRAYNSMVSDLRDSTARLAAAERDKAWSEMARQVAHEIKNPLTPIKLEIQRLQRLRQKNDPQWEEKFDKVSAVVLENIDILSHTANDFGTFARLYTEDPVEVDLDAVLSGELLLYQNREDVKITYLGAPGAVIQGPKPQLVRVFVNLLNNAIQAVEGMSEGAAVLVSLRRSDEGWEVVFEDNGPGVGEENRDKLFTPNFTTKSSGTGLGLAMCRNIVERMGGSISYSRSFSLGGACFTVRLPSEMAAISGGNK